MAVTPTAAGTTLVYNSIEYTITDQGALATCVLLKDLIDKIEQLRLTWH